MKIWIVQIGERHREVDGPVKIWRAVRLAQECAVLGHEVTYVSTTFDHLGKRFRQQEAGEHKAKGGYRLVLLHSPLGYKRNVSLARLRHQKEIATEFRRFIRRSSKPDLIVCALPTIELCCVSVEFSKESGIPVVIDIRDLWPDVYLTILPKPMRGLGKLALRSHFAAAKRALSGARALTGVSKGYLDWGLNLANRGLGEHDRVFPLGCSDMFQSRLGNSDLCERLGIESGHFVCVFVGTFGSSYDLTTVVEAFMNESEGSNLRCVLAGGGDQLENLKRKASGNPHVILPGWLDEEDCKNLLQRADVGLAAYRKSALQSLPNKVFEYMAASLPVLSSLSGEFCELVRVDGVGLNYEAGDPVSLRASVQKLIDSPKERLEMGQAGRKLFEIQYNSDVIYPGFAQWISGLH